MEPFEEQTQTDNKTYHTVQQSSNTENNTNYNLTSALNEVNI